MTIDVPHSANGVHPANVGSGDDQQQSATPIGLYQSLRAKRSNPRFRCRPPADWATPRPPPQRVRERSLHDRFWELVGGPSRGEMDCFATLAMTGSARGNGNARSTSTTSARVIKFWASPYSASSPFF